MNPKAEPPLKRIEVTGAELAVFDQGSGPTVCLVHGFPLDHTMWGEQIPALSTAYRVIAPDLRGFGQSTVSAPTVSMDRYAQDLVEMLAALDIREPITLCGLSMGGYIALAFLREHASRLSKLVLCDTRSAPDSPRAAAGRHKMAEQVLAEGTAAAAEALVPKLFSPRTMAERPQVVDSIRQLIKRSAPDGIAAAQRGMAGRADTTPLLSGIRIPTLVIVGADDAITPASEMRTVADAIPQSQFEVIPGAGHMAPLENPARFNEVLLAFLREITRRSDGEFRRATGS